MKTVAAETFAAHLSAGADRETALKAAQEMGAWPRRPTPVDSPVMDLSAAASARGRGARRGVAAQAAVSIVVPTLREAANLEPLAERIAWVLADSGVEWELLFVDDDSGDGSVAVAAVLAERLPVRLEVRRGVPPDLSRAVLEGIARSRFDRIVVMDADLSHPAERILDLLAALDGDCDMVVGSRYVTGASTAGDWGLARSLNSRVATLLASPLVTCADPMAGFFAVDRRALPDPTVLRPIGFKIGLELMVRGRLRVRELPIAFADRLRGRSKLRWRQQLDYLRHLARLYSHVLARWPRR